jgi:hemerythrin
MDRINDSQRGRQPMASFPWKGKYSVGIASIDRQHRQLVGYLNELFVALNAGKGKEALGEIFSGLIGYIRGPISLLRRV